MKIYGIIFNNFRIKNSLDLINEAYSLISIDEPATPSLSYTEHIVPKKHGSTHSKNRYEQKEITVVIEVRGRTLDEVYRNEAKLISSWIGIKSKLIIMNRPSKYYEAEVLDQIGREETGKNRLELTVTFKGSPFMYGLAHDSSDFTEDYPTRLTATAGVHKLYNYGHLPSNPVIELTGTGKAVLNFKDESFIINPISGTVYIDTENMIVYSLQNDSKTNRLDLFSGAFPTVPIGESNVAITGNVSAKIKYRDTFIC